MLFNFTFNAISMWHDWNNNKQWRLLLKWFSCIYSMYYHHYLWWKWLFKMWESISMTPIHLSTSTQTIWIDPRWKCTENKKDRTDGMNFKNEYQKVKCKQTNKWSKKPFKQATWNNDFRFWNDFRINSKIIFNNNNNNRKIDNCLP